MDGDSSENSQVNTVNPPNALKMSSSVSFSKKRIIKNFIVICSGFLLLFTAYNGLSTLQSTMNQKDGIGVASQGIIYICLCISSLLLPKYIIKKLGCKYTISVSLACYIPYIASNFYFNWVTMVPSAVLLGIASSLLWTAQSTYFKESCLIYSTLCVTDVNDKVMKSNVKNVPKLDDTAKLKDTNYSIGNRKQYRSNFEACECISIVAKPANGILKDDSAALCSNREKDHDLVGDNVSNKNTPSKQTNQLEISKFTSKNTNYIHESEAKHKISEIPIITQPVENSKMFSSVTAIFFGIFGLVCRSTDVWSNLISYYVLQNGSILDNITENSNCSCGASFCNIGSNCFEHNLAEPSQQMRNILTGVLVLLSVLAVILVFLFLDELDMDEEPTKFSFSLVMATYKFITEKKALFILPLTAYNGLIQGFYIGDFTKSFIACAWGVYHVGLVTIAFGLSSGISSIVSGFLVKYVGRIPIVMSSALINAAVLCYLLVWNPLPDHPVPFFLAATFLGVFIGIQWTQLRAFYGVAFKKDAEAAFAGSYFWNSIGYCLSFAYSNYICTYIKIYILLAVSTVAIFGYLKAEFMHIRQEKQQVL